MLLLHKFSTIRRIPFCAYPAQAPLYKDVTYKQTVIGPYLDYSHHNLQADANKTQH
jgi:hypothetical protein